MNKKLICLVLSLTMICVSSLAFAAPSKTTSDMTSVKSTSSSSSRVLGAGDGLVIEAIALTKDAAAELATISAFAAAKTGPVIDYFGGVKEQAVALLPQGFDATKLVMNELISVSVSGYEASMGDVSALFTFATSYKAGTQLIVLVGYKTGNTVTWVPLRGVVENGGVKVFFTKEVLTKINGQQVMVAVLSEDTSAK